MNEKIEKLTEQLEALQAVWNWTNSLKRKQYFIEFINYKQTEIIKAQNDIIYDLQDELKTIKNAIYE